MNSLPAGFAFVVIVICVVIGLLWIILPFAVFGLKPLVRELIREQKRTNDLLKGGGSTTAHTREPERIVPEGVMGRGERFSGSPNLPPT